jgi:hypothetical protein
VSSACDFYKAYTFTGSRDRKEGVQGESHFGSEIVGWFEVTGTSDIFTLSKRKLEDEPTNEFSKSRKP